MSDERLKIAVFIDFDNIEIGVKSTLGTYFDIGSVLEAIKERGEVVTKIAYGDWTRAGDYGRALSQHAVHMVQRNLTPGGDKNGADINLALDALEMAFTHNHINSFVIVSGDSDFISLVEKLKQYDRKVFVVGGRAFTSVVMQKNCTEFIAYENIVGRGRSADRTRTGGDGNLAQAMPLVRRALKLLADREVVPQLGLLKSTLLQLDSAFSEREYGAGSFRDFVQKLSKAGYVTLKGSERSFHVELRESGEPVSAPPVAAPTSPQPVASESPADEATARPETPPSVDAAAGEPRPGPAEAYRIIQQAVTRATVSRWPLYARQIKQIVRAFDPQFDERRYGFTSLIEALKHCQREGLLRVERDRQGIVRVWPGAQFQKPAEEGAFADVTETMEATSDRPHARVDADAGPSAPADGGTPPGTETSETVTPSVGDALPPAGEPGPEEETQEDGRAADELDASPPAAEETPPKTGRSKTGARKRSSQARGTRKTTSTRTNPPPARASRSRRAPKGDV